MGQADPTLLDVTHLHNIQGDRSIAQSTAVANTSVLGLTTPQMMKLRLSPTYNETEEIVGSTYEGGTPTLVCRQIEFTPSTLSTPASDQLLHNLPMQLIIAMGLAGNLTEHHLTRMGAEINPNQKDRPILDIVRTITE